MNAPTILPPPFDEVKEERVRDLVYAFEQGVYSNEDVEIKEEMDTLIEEKVAHRFQMMITYN